MSGRPKLSAVRCDLAFELRLRRRRIFVAVNPQRSLLRPGAAKETAGTKAFMVDDTIGTKIPVFTAEYMHVKPIA